LFQVSSVGKKVVVLGEVEVEKLQAISQTIGTSHHAAKMAMKRLWRTVKKTSLKL
jgi:hypothetical protein